ncbi:hypothetical protein EJ110_NYTH00342 [Nymphaea thermarum]|nr:hypothetical protein EJ110_NYTH00342 [Nymphaea thermarum]
MALPDLFVLDPILGVLIQLVKDLKLQHQHQYGCEVPTLIAIAVVSPKAQRREVPALLFTYARHCSSHVPPDAQHGRSHRPTPLKFRRLLLHRLRSLPPPPPVTSPRSAAAVLRLPWYLCLRRVSAGYSLPHRRPWRSIVTALGGVLGRRQKK